MKRILIVSGGNIDYDFSLAFCKENQFDLCIGVDGGLEVLKRLHLKPDYIVGDFDTVKKEVLDYYLLQQVNVREFNPIKDATDTHMAMELAISLGATTIYLLGATGKRVDHLLGNLQILNLPLQAGVEAFIVDPYNRIRLIASGMKIKKEEQYGTYISFLPQTTEVTGVTLTGFKYPLRNHTLTNQDSLGISNEILEDIAEISFDTGIVIMIESKD